MAILKNSKHEIFARNRASGMNLKDSAVSAGYPEPRARKTGWELGKKGDIASRIQEIKALAASGTVMSIKERQERLTEIARMPITKDVSARESVQSIAENNKMTPGAYPPEKHEVETGEELTAFLKGLRGYGKSKE